MKAKAGGALSCCLSEPPRAPWNTILKLAHNNPGTSSGPHLVPQELLPSNGVVVGAFLGGGVGVGH